jgi:YidC/Oxa1 family membrane protein insertase
MQSHDPRQIIGVIILCALILFGGDYLLRFFQDPTPAPEAVQSEATTPQLTSGSGSTGASQPHLQHIEEPAVSSAPSVHIETGNLSGSLSTRGLVLNTLTLRHYKADQKKNSGPVQLLNLYGKDAYISSWSVKGEGPGITFPHRDTLWTASHSTLTPKQPVQFTWTSPEGVRFIYTLSYKASYLFEMELQVLNPTDKGFSVSGEGFIQRKEPLIEGGMLVFEGPLGVFDGHLKEVSYSKLSQKKRVPLYNKSGWLGITDKYWLVAMAPQDVFSGAFQFQAQNPLNTSALYASERVHVPAKGTAKTRSLFFAGPKILTLLDLYEKDYKIPHFDLAVDFGWFYFLTKPIFYGLQYLKDATGSFWMAILLFTVLMKLLFFPLANRSYRSMARMRELQPLLESLKERYKGKPQEMSQKLMALYREKKINPVSGCLPMLLQIPFAFALYKVLSVSIEMRHAGFPGWITDLSVADPTNIFTLFGLLPLTLPSFLHVGAWPVLMGISMFAQQKLNPPPADPTQKAMFLYIMPLVFTYMMSQLAAGLVIYWTWSNLLSILQQWYITHTHKVKAR